MSKEYLELFENAQSNPKKTLPLIQAFAEKNPDMPQANNLLAYALLRNKKLKKAESLIVTTYQKHPNYLFGKINYADLCLRKKRINEIPQIFSSFDLSQLYPEKEQFHFSEFRGFMVLMGFYHLALGQRKAAEVYYTLAVKADPLHPGVEALEKKLFKFSLKKLLSRILPS
jgi:tetratricopeptide (TPR) repeat protein